MRAEVVIVKQQRIHLNIPNTEKYVKNNCDKCIHTHRQTDRPTDRQKNRQTDRHTCAKFQTHTHTHIHSHNTHTHAPKTHVYCKVTDS